MLRVLITRRWPEAVERRFRETFDTALNDLDLPLGADGLAAALERYDVLCPTVTDRITAEVIAAARPLRTRLRAEV